MTVKSAMHLHNITVNYLIIGIQTSVSKRAYCALRRKSAGFPIINDEWD